MGAVVSGKAEARQTGRKVHTSGGGGRRCDGCNAVRCVVSVVQVLVSAINWWRARLCSHVDGGQDLLSSGGRRLLWSSGSRVYFEGLLWRRAVVES